MAQSRMLLTLVAVLGCTRGRETLDEPESGSGPAMIVSPEREPDHSSAGEGSQAGPASGESGEADATEGFTAATRGSGTCRVTVSALLEAAEYRGAGPMTPALEASLSANPDYARMYESESHGDHHIQCIYQVELAHEPGKHYRWRHVIGNTLRDYTAETCDGLAAEVAEDVIRTTKDCSDLDAGAYWGCVLEPMP